MAYHGIYRGTVLNTADPTMKGRLQVTIPVVSGPTSGWAMPCRDYNSKDTPPIGTVVWVMFEGGDPSFPVWMGCAT